MKKQLAIGGLVVVAAVAGTTGVAIAHASGSGSVVAAPAAPTGSATSGTPGSGPTAPGAKGAKGKDASAAKGANGAKGQERAAAAQILGNLKDLQHAEWVTKGDANAAVTHAAIQGTVKDVSATSITVTAADGTSMTFAVDSATAVHQQHGKGAGAVNGKGNGNGNGATKDPNAAKPTIADVKAGQTVLVGGTKSPDLTAKTILVRAG